VLGLLLRLLPLPELRDEVQDGGGTVRPGKLLIVDGMNMFLRNFAVVPQMDSNGEHVGGVVGMLRSLRTCVRDVGPDLTVVVWDGPGGSRRRRGIFAEYKAGRKPRVNRAYEFDESPQRSEQNFRRQLGSARRYVELLGVCQVELEDIEADDVIAFVARHMFPDSDKVIVSSDRDFLQLVDARTLVYSPSKKLYYGCDRVLEEFGCLPENYIFVKALVGDASDNVKGLKGLGPKTVAKLFPVLAEREVTLEELLAYAEQRKEDNKKYGTIVAQRDVVTSNVQLMQLATPVISAQSVRAIRHALDARPDYFPSELKLSLMRDGIQIVDSDFFGVFNAHSIIRKRREQE
jgi:5'-3' exonuclease